MCCFGQGPSCAPKTERVEKDEIGRYTSNARLYENDHGDGPTKKTYRYARQAVTSWSFLGRVFCQTLANCKSVEPSTALPVEKATFRHAMLRYIYIICLLLLSSTPSSRCAVMLGRGQARGDGLNNHLSPARRQSPDSRSDAADEVPFYDVANGIKGGLQSVGSKSPNVLGAAERLAADGLTSIGKGLTSIGTGIGLVAMAMVLRGDDIKGLLAGTSPAMQILHGMAFLVATAALLAATSAFLAATAASLTGVKREWSKGNNKLG
jgi:hypothetical protein